MITVVVFVFFFLYYKYVSLIKLQIFSSFMAIWSLAVKPNKMLENIVNKNSNQVSRTNNIPWKRRHRTSIIYKSGCQLLAAILGYSPPRRKWTSKETTSLCTRSCVNTWNHSEMKTTFCPVTYRTLFIANEGFHIRMYNSFQKNITMVMTIP